MSGYRDSLFPEQVPAYDQAMTAAAIVLGRGRSRRDSLSPEEAAREAWTPGGMSVEELTALIKRHRAEARAALEAKEAAA